MKYLFMVILTPLFILTSCDFKNPLEKLKPQKQELEFESGLKEPMYTCTVPGIPTGERSRFGGLYTKYSAEEVAGLVGKPVIPPDPRYEMKAWITLLAKAATGIGFLGLLAAAVLFVYQNPVWDDIAIVAAVSFSSGLTIAISYNLIAIVIPLITLSAVCYFGYVIYCKQTKEKVNDEMLDMCDVLTGVVDESPELVEHMQKAGVVSNKFKKHLDRSIKRRNGTREKKLKEAKELLAAAG